MSITQHTSMHRRGSRRKWLRGALTAGLLAGTVGVIGTSASAAHGNAELPGSNFEIDDDANLKNDDGAPHVDWADLAHPNGPELRATDEPTGQTDDSYKGGTKEDTECPGEVTGSIPNNKSDLLTFHGYEEPDSPGFLNLAWSRVSDPSGTTLMDFEFNQSTMPCPQGPNVMRTDGDLLLEYAIDQGGARAAISGRVWDGTNNEWGQPFNLSNPGPGDPTCDGGPCAVGTINGTVIPAAESDGLGEKQPRTFGEAQINLDLIFNENKCVSFGSAMLKSRSSDSFTSQLKDFIAPVPIDLQNCGNVIIRKQTDPDGASALFGFTKDFDTEPATSDTFTLMDNGVKDFSDDVLFGTGYTVTEDVLPSGWDFVDIDCSASKNVTPVIDGATITFDINSDEDLLDCTYNNRARAELKIVKKANVADFQFDFTSATLGDFSMTPTGNPPYAETTYSNLVPGTYDVAEDLTSQPDFDLDSATCDNGNDPANITLGAGDSVECTFVNTARADLHVVKVAERDDVDFTFTSSTLDLSGFDPPGSFTLQNGGQEDFTDLDLGPYDVAETVPDGWNLVASSCDNGDDPSNITLGVAGDVTCTFENVIERGAIKIVKTRKHAADGPGDHPQDGVTFTITNATNATNTDVVTDTNGEACVDGLPVSLLDGDYTVTETLPGGYANDTLVQVVSVSESTCLDGDGVVATFANTPLTNVTVSVDSQVDGGTASVIVCTDSDGSMSDANTGANGDGSLTVYDLLPTDPTVTLTCTITVDP